ncbi:proline--tRNA ligase [Candidatus Sumerlaeota bacterium]|nr:proline--tRNA ligase [Candidatus Sumerlaeota bacterium]
MAKVQTAITPTRAEDYAEWYQQVIKAADLAETSPVRGCMVIKPWGYALWENIQRILDGKFKETGHRNAYFPIFIPKSFLEKEAEHVEGFAKECAVVTHHRLEQDADGKLHPAGELEEPLIVRPTSETIIGAMFAKWVQSYRDLPLLMNQWANIVRWEMRTRLFLRTTEFLWQEGHTAHATQDCAMEETRMILDLYADFAENYLAMPVIKGEKSEGERFPGAVNTYSIEAMMQDRKALQAGTSHFLGQNFARAQEIKYLSEEGKEEFAWTTSWGVSTRLIGGLIMSHADDDGLICPPRVAPAHVVILPVLHKDDVKGEVLEYCRKLTAELRGVMYDGRPVVVELDDRDIRGGEKNWGWVKKGAPLIVEVGPRDIANDSVFVGRRDKSRKERYGQSRAEFVSTLPATLDEIQNNLFSRAKAYRDEHTRKIGNEDDFRAFFTPDNAERPEIHGGFALAHFCGDAEIEDQIARELGVTIRCLPVEGEKEPGTCIFTGKPSAQRAVFGKAY